MVRGQTKCGHKTTLKFHFLPILQEAIDLDTSSTRWRKICKKREKKWKWGSLFVRQSGENHPLVWENAEGASVQQFKMALNHSSGIFQNWACGELTHNMSHLLAINIMWCMNSRIGGESWNALQNAAIYRQTIVNHGGLIERGFKKWYKHMQTQISHFLCQCFFPCCNLHANYCNLWGLEGQEPQHAAHICTHLHAQLATTRIPMCSTLCVTHHRCHVELICQC